MHEELKKLDLKDYKLPKKQKGKNLCKIQRLTLEIISYCGIDKKMTGRWFRIVKKNTAFVEDAFLRFKRTGIKNAAYLFRMIYPKK